MHRTLTALAGGAVLGLALAAACGSPPASPASQTVAWSAPGGHHPHVTASTGTVPPPGAGASCTQGPLDYGVHPLTVSADWEPPGSCGWTIKTCVTGTDGIQRCGGPVKATELVTTSPQAFGQMTGGWLVTRLPPNGASFCWGVFPRVATSWGSCPPPNPAAADRAPECNTMRLLTPSGQSIWLSACGSGPGNESQVQDFTTGSLAQRTAIMDGVTALTPSNCPHAQPCVLIGDNTPHS